MPVRDNAEESGEEDGWRGERDDVAGLGLRQKHLRNVETSMGDSGWIKWRRAHVELEPASNTSERILLPPMVWRRQQKISHMNVDMALI